LNQNEAGKRFHSQLTCREIRVLGLVADGLSSKGVGQKLGIAPSTVESHLESAKSKLGAKSRPNLIARAIACGLIDPLADMDETALRGFPGFSSSGAQANRT
jgi:DNA-binding CsgD family transcriptional regulator